MDPEKLRDNNKEKIIIAVHHVIPGLVQKLPWANYTIARTMWETIPFPSQWVPKLQQVDFITLIVLNF